ncbi:MAG: molybdate ABC transporter permease subunit [Nocardioidaceae bacterium]|nr:molybdate ABC transporter permease subunit [Nocardioidaceae bacterium]
MSTSDRPARRPTAAATGRLPWQLLLPSFLAVALLALPVVGLLVRAPWSTLAQQVRDPEVLQALRLSLLTASTSTVVCLVLGTPLAWLLARSTLPGRRALRTLVTVPLVLPPVVGGVALLTVFGRTGIVGGWVYEASGYRLPFTTAGVVVAQTFVAMPFLVLAVEGALRSADPRFDDVAATFGASRWQTFSRVTLPLALPGILSGAILAWARALGEFGATITFNGSFPGTTRTMPSAVYNALNTDFDAAILLSLILLVVSVAILALLRERWLIGAVS